MTAGDNSDESDHIRVAELAHDARLRQKVQPILLRRTCLQRFQCNNYIVLARQSHMALAHVAELTYQHVTQPSSWNILQYRIMTYDIQELLPDFLQLMTSMAETFRTL